MVGQRIEFRFPRQRGHKAASRRYIFSGIVHGGDEGQANDRQDMEKITDLVSLLNVVQDPLVVHPGQLPVPDRIHALAVDKHGIAERNHLLQVLPAAEGAGLNDQVQIGPAATLENGQGKFGLEQDLAPGQGDAASAHAVKYPILFHLRQYLLWCIHLSHRPPGIGRTAGQAPGTAGEIGLCPVGLRVQRDGPLGAGRDSSAAAHALVGNNVGQLDLLVQAVGITAPLAAQRTAF